MQTLTNEGDVGELRERLGLLQPGDTRRWGKMAAPDMVVHVRQIFRAVMGEIAVDAPSMPKPAPLPGPMLKWFALRFPRRWPPTIETPLPFRTGSSWMAVGDFNEDREAAVASMERFAQGEWTITDHPMFGRMSFGDWTRWGWLHVDHHLRQFGR